MNLARKRTIESYFPKPNNPSKRAVAEASAPIAGVLGQPEAAQAGNTRTIATTIPAIAAIGAATTGAAGVVLKQALLPGASLAESQEAPQQQVQGGGQGGGLLELLHEPSWQAVLKGEFAKPHFKRLQAFVDGELAAADVKVYPPKEHIFRAFNSCPFNEVKVVIIGQDPYHGPRQAMGLSFSVPPGVKVPSSLQNIFKELKTDLGCEVPNHGDLETWASQGVLLLNAVLTVRAGEANSHSKKGWEELTDAAIRQLNQQRAGIVFLLWGRFAQEKAKLIDGSKHHVLMAAHPSGLSAHRGFFGCRHFSKANALLALSSREPINWCIGRV